LLLQEFVKQYQKHEKEREEAIKAGILDPQNLPDLPLPKVSYVCPASPSSIVFNGDSRKQGKVRQIMTRADFIEGSLLSFHLGI